MFPQVLLACICFWENIRYQVYVVVFRNNFLKRRKKVPGDRRSSVLRFCCCLSKHLVEETNNVFWWKATSIKNKEHVVICCPVQRYCACCCFLPLKAPTALAWANQLHYSCECPVRSDEIIQQTFVTSGSPYKNQCAGSVRTWHVCSQEGHGPSRSSGHPQHQSPVVLEVATMLRTKNFSPGNIF